MAIDIGKDLWDVECCSGTGHTVREGGKCINIVVLNKKAFSQFLAAYDSWLDGKKRWPRAAAILCDTCMREKREPLWAVGQNDGGPVFRVPVCELGDWVFAEAAHGS